MASVDVAPSISESLDPGASLLRVAPAALDSLSFADSSSLVVLSTLAVRSPSASSTGRAEGSEGEDDKSSRDEANARLRGGYRCSKCGRPKKGHVCPSGTSTFPNLTFIGYDDNAGDMMDSTEVEMDQERRVGLLRRIDLLEREIARLTGENAHLRSTVNSYQLGFPSGMMAPNLSPSSNAMVNNPNGRNVPQYNVQLVLQPLQGNGKHDCDAGIDFDSQPPSKRPRFNNDQPNGMAQNHSYAFDVAPNQHHLNAHYHQNQAPATQIQIVYRQDPVNAPISLTSVNPSPNAPMHPTAILQPSPYSPNAGNLPSIPFVQVSPPSLINHSSPNTNHQEPLHPQSSFKPFTNSLNTPRPMSPGSDHSWLRIPKPQLRTQPNQAPLQQSFFAPQQQLQQPIPQPPYPHQPFV